jgi:polyisoprenoid-binding protein YceI
MTSPITRTSLALLAVLAGSWLAAPAWAQAPLYQVDTTTSRVYIRVDTATRLGHPHGVVGNLAASSVGFGGNGELVFDMPSFVADTPEARQYVGLEGRFADAQKVTASMLSEAVLDVDRHPKAVFAISGVAPLDGQAPGQAGRYKVTGRLTLRGTAQPVEFTAKVEQADKPGALRMRGQFSILQTRYGIQPYSALGGLVRVADELKIWGDLILTPAGR